MTSKIRKPDLNAPRFRPKRTSLLNEAFYTRFKKKYPQYKDVSNKLLKSVIVGFNKKLWETVIEYRDGVELPENIGYIFIGTCNPAKKNNPDYIKSLKYNQQVSHRNFASDNHLAKIFYTNFNNKYRLVDREIWQFKGERDFTRAVGREYPENWKKYIRVEPYMLINELYKKRMFRNNYIKEVSELTKDYNEFDLN
jgi:hypothetical protein